MIGEGNVITIVKVKLRHDDAVYFADNLLLILDVDLPGWKQQALVRGLLNRRPVGFVQDRATTGRWSVPGESPSATKGLHLVEQDDHSMTPLG